MKTGSVPYKIALKEAEPYMGMIDLDVDPHSLEAEHQTLTSAPPPKTTPSQEPEAAESEGETSSGGDDTI